VTARSSAESWDALWLGIRKSPIADLYLAELHGIADAVVQRTETVFERARTTSEGGAGYLQVDHEVSGMLEDAVTDAARVRSLVVARRRDGSESAVTFELRKRRAAWLREQVLQGVRLEVVLGANVRNTLEHFDEYIDNLARQAAKKEITPPIIVPVDFLVSHRRTLDILLQGRGGVVRPLRGYYADERLFVNAGREVDVGALNAECRAIRDRVAQHLPRGILEEPGGSAMYVLTETSFEVADLEQPASDDQSASRTHPAGDET
jgi:hypothetical protein